DKQSARQDRADDHSYTFANNDLPIAARLQQHKVMQQEPLTDHAASLSKHPHAAFARMARQHELIKAVHGKGLLIGIEFGAARSLKLKASWNALEAVNTGLFCQLITIPLCQHHNILIQVAGHGIHTIKLLPSLIISEADCECIE